MNLTSRRHFLAAITGTAAALVLSPASKLCAAIGKFLRPNGLNFSGFEFQPGDFERGTIIRDERARDLFAGEDHPFFAVGAREAIAWGIELCLAMQAAADCDRHGRGDSFWRGIPETPRDLVRLLADREMFETVCSLPFADATDEFGKGCFLMLLRVQVARFHFNTRYWTLPEETRGGLHGTLATWLSAYENETLAALAVAFPVAERTAYLGAGAFFLARS